MKIKTLKGLTDLAESMGYEVEIPHHTGNDYKTVPAEFLTFLRNAQIGSGVCMCGGDMIKTADHAGHEPVDHWDHNLRGWLADIDSLNTFGTLTDQALATAKQHRDRYAELLNLLIEATGQPQPDLGNPPWQGPDLCSTAVEVAPFIKAMRKLLDDISGWLVCAAITTPEDMAGSFEPFLNEIEALLRPPCCVETEEELQMLRDGDFNREELYGIGGKPSCPKCAKGDR